MSFFRIVLFSLIALFAYLGFTRIGNFLPIIPKPELTRSQEDKMIFSNSPKELNDRLKLPKGFNMGYFTSDVPGARDLQLSPGGTLLASLPGEGRVIALPDEDKDGIANQLTTLLFDLNKPHGLAFFENKLYVAEENRVARYSWNEKKLSAEFEETILEIPTGGMHYTRSIVFDQKGQLYISIGSSCNTCVEENPWRGTVLRTNKHGQKLEIFAKGLRNSVFLKIKPETNQLWGTEMGRDLLGDKLPPDEINLIKRGDYGWPVCYGRGIYDQDFGELNEKYCRQTHHPYFEVPAHSAPLGLTFVKSSQFPKAWQGNLLVAYHGSWNSTVPVGYKIVRISQNSQGKVVANDLVSGFLENNFEAFGRPVDLEFGKRGELYLSDDKAGAIYILTRENNKPKE